jgi:cholesterol transport system auxiliary component
VLIAPVRAAAGYTSSDLIYVKDTFELHRFVYHRWADTPARMLEPLLRLAIERTGRFGAVLPSGSQAQAELRLNSELLRLRQVFAGERSYIEFKLRVDLIDVQSGRFVAGRIFSYQEPCTASTPQAGVNAANKAVTLFMEELQQFLIGYLGTK